MAHTLRQIKVMEKTPPGFSAFDNIEKYKPRNKNGETVKVLIILIKEWNGVNLHRLLRPLTEQFPLNRMYILGEK